MKTKLYRLFCLTAGLLALSTAHAQSFGSAGNRSDSHCEAGSACVAPNSTPGAGRATSDGSQDVLMGKVYRAQDVNPGANSAQCQRAGGNECVSPQAGSYVAIPYPQITALVLAFDPSMGVTGNWTTANAVGANLVCANSATSAVAYSGPVPTYTGASALPGSSSWPSGQYACTLAAQNSVGRTATQSVNVMVVAPLTLDAHYRSKQHYWYAPAYVDPLLYSGYPFGSNSIPQSLGSGYTVVTAPFAATAYAARPESLFFWTTTGAASAALTCFNSGSGSVVWTGVVPVNVLATQPFEMPGQDGWAAGNYSCTLTASDGAGNSLKKTFALAGGDYFGVPATSLITYYSAFLAVYQIPQTTYIFYSPGLAWTVAANTQRWMSTLVPWPAWYAPGYGSESASLGGTSGYYPSSNLDASLPNAAPSYAYITIMAADGSYEQSIELMQLLTDP